MNQDGFASFFEQRYSSTAILHITMGASRADAEDAVQEAMIAAWQKWETIHEPAAWVRTTALRKLWKNSQHLPTALAVDSTTQPAGHDPDLAVFSEEQRQVISLLRRLPAGQRTVTALYYDGLSAAEIGEITGRPSPTVRSQLRHARRTLKEVIASERSALAAPDA